MKFFGRFNPFCLALISIIFLCQNAHAETLKDIVSELEILPIHYGENRIQIGNETVLIMRASFPSDNASTRDLYTVLSSAENTPQWVRKEEYLDQSKSIVIETWPHTHEDSLQTVRFLVPKGNKPQKLYLLDVKRSLETGYVPTIAKFMLSVMQRAPDFDAPVFHEIATLISENIYCNADWAAHRELGLTLREQENEFPCK